jgi:UTP--glucose-1-phosphate uridylyltransferase
MKTAVITTGGLGTRLLTATKVNPKTMLPLYVKSTDSDLNPFFQPLIEIIFNNLYDCGFRKFCFIVGKKGQYSIKNHLIPDPDFLKLLKSRNNSIDKRFIRMLEKSYKKYSNSKVSWITQSTPMGFGHALLSAKKFVGNDNFLLHAGDAYFPNYDFLKTMINTFKKSNGITGSILLQHKKNVEGYGIAQTTTKNHEHLVINVEEKPKKPKSNLAILPVYLFDKNIFSALKKISHGYNGELQVTDAIKYLLDDEKKFIANNFRSNWFDIGTVHRYYDAISYSYKKSVT